METYTPEEFDIAWRALQAEFENPDLGEKVKNILAIHPELARCKLGDDRQAMPNGYCVVHQ